MAFAKPNVNNLWALTGEIVEPASAKIAQGWVEEIPDFEFENWIQNRQDQFNAHVNQYGMPVWDSVTEYIADKSYVQGSDGVIYKAITTNTNKNPITSNLDWKVAFDSADSSYTKTESDGRFLQKINNLSDLNNKATARTELSVYSKIESDNKYQTSDPLVGMVAPFASNTTPTGWLKCDGSAVSRSTYLALFNRIGTLYGTGDGSTTFNLPDLRGEFVRGFDDGRGVDSGRSIGTYQSDDYKSHSHSASTNSSGSHSHTGSTSVQPNHTHTFLRGTDDGVNQGVQTGTAVGGSITSNGGGSHSHILEINSSGSHSHTVTVNSTGGSETRPRNIAMLYCIKV